MNFGKDRNSGSTMKSFSVFLVFILAAGLAGAQTDTNAMRHAAGGNECDDGGAGPGGHGDRNTVAPRAMSLEDCLQEALQHNLDVQISRYNPQIQLFNVRASYGGYDPMLTLSGDGTNTMTPGRILKTPYIFPARHRTNKTRRRRACRRRRRRGA